MARMVAEVMTQDPICASADCPVSEAARRMADADVGAVLVVDAEQVVGLCTDRDITVRVTAANRGPRDTTVRETCTDRTRNGRAELDMALDVARNSDE